jgi:hypothetical protein
MDPFDLAKGLRARQAANIGDALNRSAGTTALTVQAYTGSFGPSAPVTRPFNQQYVDELANTQRFEIMKTANEKFKGWLEDDTKTFADLLLWWWTTCRTGWTTATLWKTPCKVRQGSS